MKIIRKITEFKQYRNNLKKQQVGYIPTMGALHAGHLSLIQQSVESFQLTIVSIFINPTQFDNPSDLHNYPNLLNKDLEQLNIAGVDCVFLPDYAEMYPDNYTFSVVEKELSQQYCGAYRSAHFDGVLTIVMKLLNLVRPDRAYFGEKDYQQLTLIRQMVGAFFMPTKIIAGATIREKDGLAMSSRNLNLTAEQRKIAPLLYKIIISGLSLKQMKKQLMDHGFQLDYLEFLDGHLLVAAHLGNVRLIDNVKINKLENAA